MKKNERDHNLELFCLYVEHGKTPPEHLQRFVAEGVREFLSYGKPWQLGKGGSPGTLTKPSARTTCVKSHILKSIGCSNDRIAELLHFVEKDGADYTRKIQRWSKEGQSVADNSGSGEVEFRWAAEALLETSVTLSEKKSIHSLLDKLDHDNQEPNYE